MRPEVMQVVLMDRARAHGPMLDVCPVPGCSTLTMGGTCVEHDAPARITFPRGRPFIGTTIAPGEPLGVVAASRPAPPV